MITSPVLHPPSLSRGGGAGAEPCLWLVQEASALSEPATADIGDCRGGRSLDSQQHPARRVRHGGRSVSRLVQLGCVSELRRGPQRSEDPAPPAERSEAA